jgi:glycosyltransferase involved in cell wall biosynthesis
MNNFADLTPLVSKPFEPGLSEAGRAPHYVSVVVPLYNEEENLAPLIEALLPVLDILGHDCELLIVNDGSTDRTGQLATELSKRDKRIRVIHLRGNAGQTAAMMAGFDNARGDVIVPIDGDLQNDPADIPRLVEMLDRGFDVVSGWRKKRSDDLILRKIPSWIANSIISRVSGVRLHDYGCTLKAYRRDVLSGVRLYGELHRFVPIFASWQGGRITEMVVNHRPREHGLSKYGIDRVFKVVLDLMLVRFLTKYQAKAIYVFGAVGLFFFAIAFAVSLYAVYLKIFHAISFILTPLPLIAAFGFMTGFMCILLGLIAELLVRTYFESQGRLPYIIGSRINFDAE